MRIYVDTCVLRMAWNGKEPHLVLRAIHELSRSDVTHLHSVIVELEVLPMPTYQGRQDEVAFFQKFFGKSQRIPCNEKECARALVEAGKVGMSACDALHVSCALSGGADELLTAEGVGRALPKSTAVKVRTIRY